MSCNSNVRKNLELESNREVLSKIVCVKLRDDMHNPEMMALKEHVTARYRLSDLIRAQKVDNLTSHLSKWITRQIAWWPARE